MLSGCGRFLGLSEGFIGDCGRFVFEEVDFEKGEEFVGVV